MMGAMVRASLRAMMRASLRASMQACGVCLIAAASTLSAAQESGKGVTQEAKQATKTTDAELEAMLLEIDGRIGKIEDLRARFEQRKSSPLLRRPIVSSGEVIARGDVVLWRTERPRPAEMLVGGGEIRLLYPEDKLLEVYPIGNAKGMAGGPLPRLHELRERFTFVRAPKQETDNASQSQDVLLTPIAEEMRRSVASVRVSIDTSVPCVTKIVMTDPEGEQTTIEFSAIRINTGVKEKDVRLRVPEGTRESRPLEGASDKNAARETNEPARAP